MRRLATGCIVVALLWGCDESGRRVPQVDIDPSRGGPSSRLDGGVMGCSAHTDCPFGMRCVSGICEVEVINTRDDGCRSDDDCPVGQACAESTGQCVDVRPGATVTPPDESTCTDGELRRCGSKIGACEYGVERCIGSEWSGRCEGGIAPASEVCNLLDDDCDGDTDEDFTLGAACEAGVGACLQTGVIMCSTDTSTTMCSATPLDATGLVEICGNNIDDDCNGLVDDGCTGPVVMCPGPVTARPLTATTLVGMATDADGVIVSWRWEVVSQPAGANGTFANPNAQTTSFTPPLVGIYRVRLTVTDDSGLTASCEFDITAVGQGIRVEVTWTSNDTDVDTHLLRMAGGTAWFNSPNDCYYANRTPSWDAPGPADDPRLDIDDVNGFGPENINIDAPVVGATYRVGVHYFSDHGNGPTTVTVRIYCGDISVTPAVTQVRSLNGASGNTLNDFWRVADLVWDATGNCTVNLLNSITTGSGARLIP